MKQEKKWYKEKTESLKRFFFKIFLRMIVLVFLMEIFFFYRAYNMTVDTEKKHINVLLSTISKNASANLEYVEHLTLFHLFNPDVYSFYRYVNQHQYSSNFYMRKEYLQLATKCRSAIISYIALSKISILSFGFIPAQSNPDKIFYIETENDGVSGFSINEYYKDDKSWYGSFNKDNNSYTVICKGNKDFNNGNDCILFARKVLNQYTHETEGYILLALSPEIFSDAIELETIDENSSIIVENNYGIIIYQSQEENEFDSTDLINSNENFSYYSYKDPKLMIFRYDDPDKKFSYFYLTPSKQIVGSVFENYWLLFTFLLIITIISICSFSGISKSVSKSVDRILEFIQKLPLETKNKENILGSISSYEHISEFCQISISLENMQCELIDHIDREYRMEINQNIAEYKALQSEINPHFLFNAFSLLLALNREGRQKSLEKALIGLSSMFQYNCSHKRTSTINEEVAEIEKYLFIQRLRYEDRLIYKFDIDPLVNNFRIPRLLIQPIIENAIVHGLEPVEKTVLISLTVASFEWNGKSCVIILVRNDGAEYRAEMDEKEHTGLSNIRSRLSIMYPNSYIYLTNRLSLTECGILIINS